MLLVGLLSCRKIIVKGFRHAPASIREGACKDYGILWRVWSSVAVSFRMVVRQGKREKMDGEGAG